LLRGKPVLSDGMLKAAGFSFEVTPNSIKSPSSAIVKIDRKEFKDGTYTATPSYREEFSFQDKNPDEIMGFLYGLFRQHLTRNLAAQTTFQQQKKGQAPTPADIKAAYEASKSTR
jgi:hypothetical protein